MSNPKPQPDLTDFIARFQSVLGPKFRQEDLGHKNKFEQNLHALLKVSRHLGILNPSREFQELLLQTFQRQTDPQKAGKLDPKNPEPFKPSSPGEARIHWKSVPFETKFKIVYVVFTRLFRFEHFTRFDIINGNETLFTKMFKVVRDFAAKLADCSAQIQFLIAEHEERIAAIERTKADIVMARNIQRDIIEGNEQQVARKAQIEAEMGRLGREKESKQTQMSRNTMLVGQLRELNRQLTAYREDEVRTIADLEAKLLKQNALLIPEHKEVKQLLWDRESRVIELRQRKKQLEGETALKRQRTEEGGNVVALTERCLELCNEVKKRGLVRGEAEGQATWLQKVNEGTVRKNEELRKQMGLLVAMKADGEAAKKTEKGRLEDVARRTREVNQEAQWSLAKEEEKLERLRMRKMELEAEVARLGERSAEVLEQGGLAVQDFKDYVRTLEEEKNRMLEGLQRAKHEKLEVS